MSYHNIDIQYSGAVYVIGRTPMEPPNLFRGESGLRVGGGHISGADLPLNVPSIFDDSNTLRQLDDGDVSDAWSSPAPRTAFQLDHLVG
jgi:hypothetical protein